MADSSGGASLARCRTLGTFRSADVEFVGLAGDVSELVALAERRLDSAAGHALSVERSNTSKSYRDEALVAEARSGVSVVQAFDGLSERLVGSHARSVAIFCRNFRRQQ